MNREERADFRDGVECGRLECQNSTAELIKSAHGQVLQILRLGEQDCWMPSNTAQRIIDILVEKIRGGISYD